MITINNLNYSILDGDSKKMILNNIGLTFKEGEVNLIYGPSGSGKTTLLYALSGMLENIDSGEIIIDDLSIYKLSEKKRDDFRLNNMGMIFQNLNLFPYMSIIENIYMPIYAKDIKPTKDDDDKLNELVDLLGLNDYLNKPIYKLSGGQQQRIAIIRSFITKPKIVLCDEPTASLDSENSKIFYKSLQDISHRENCTVIIVSHDELAKEYSDKFIKLVDGKIEE